MLWFALHLPLLSLEAFCATLSPQAQQRPVALLAGHAISAVNAAAAQCGIRPGCKRATALALSSQLLLAEADAQRDAAALLAVAHAALAFTPSVCLHDGQTVLLEVQASLRLFGGAAALLARLQQAVQPLGHQLQLAAAPTALGAAVLARWHPPAVQGPQVLGPQASQRAALQRLLQAAPVYLLGPGREHWDDLQGMGLQTLGDLRALPRTGLARRFGEALLDELDRAWGDRPDPRVWLQLPERFEARLELYARADTADQVLHGASVLLARLVAWAQARQSRVAAFSLFMHHEARHRGSAPAATELPIALAEPALDPAHLQMLLRERLGPLQLAAPTLELRLHCQHLVQGSAPNGELFPSRASAAEGLTRLLERLRARLGDAQVLQLRAVADHRPEYASRALPVQALVPRPPLAPGSVPGTRGSPRAGGAGPGPAPAPARGLPVSPVSGLPVSPARGLPGTPAPVVPLPLHRPAWLMPEPLPLAERDGQPLLDGQLLQLLSGPERIETGWWDGQPVARDYFIAQAPDGALVWIWRGRLPAAWGDVNWFLQGRFA